MRRRLLAACLALLLPTPSVLRSGGAAAECGCSKAMCCHAAKRPASGHSTCHDPQPDPREAGLQCHHRGAELTLSSTIALLPPPPAVTLALGESRRSDAWAGRPLDLFLPLESPPPKPRLA